MILPDVTIDGIEYDMDDENIYTIKIPLIEKDTEYYA